MPPLQLLSATMSSFLRRDLLTADEVRSTWVNPSDILSLLLIVGGDVIQRALAQQIGPNYWPTPVVFSFGWVAYSFNALLSAVGDKRLMPAPDLSLIVFSTECGHVRTNQSWVLSRILRDFEDYWMPSDVRKALNSMLSEAGKPKAGLCVSVFEVSDRKVAGIPHRDGLWWSGYLIALAQLGIAAIPWGLWFEWEIFAIAAGGTLLAFLTGSLSQWRRERWACRRESNKIFVLSRGNGAQHALVIIGGGRGLDLEDLASSTDGVTTSSFTRAIIAVLTTLWVVLLITVSGMKERTWFLVAIGALGMVHTVVVAGAPRKPEVFGMHLTFQKVFVQSKVMATLKSVELAYPTVGISMLPIFFPGKLRPEDAAWWKKIGVTGRTQDAVKESTIPGFGKNSDATASQSEK